MIVLRSSIRKAVDAALQGDKTTRIVYSFASSRNCRDLLNIIEEIFYLCASERNTKVFFCISERAKQI